ncbi:MAG: hypothetical protein J2P19_33645 [Pseudonocardia sp.]|nr:hypothetical protein [Pseudonocardia sp.]
MSPPGAHARLLVGYGDDRGTAGRRMAADGYRRVGAASMRAGRAGAGAFGETRAEPSARGVLGDIGGAPGAESPG